MSTNSNAEINSLTVLSDEQKRALIETLKIKAAPLMEYSSLNWSAEKKLSSAADLYTNLRYMKKSKIGTFLFSAFHYAIVSYGVDFSIEKADLFSGPVLTWYGNLYMLVINFFYEMAAEKAENLFLVQTLTLLALAVSPFLVGLILLFLLRLLRTKLTARRRIIASAQLREQAEAELARAEELKKSADLSDLFFIPSRYHSGTCLAQIIAELESGRAKSLQHAFTNCEEYLKERFGSTFLINVADSTKITYYKYNYEYKETI